MDRLADWVIERLTGAQVGRLATADAEGAVHLVPVCFALVSGRAVSAVDHKPKRTMQLGRLQDIRETGRAVLLVDHYDDDWSQLWWVRADGIAEIHYSGEEMATAYFELRRKYVQYQRIALDGPVIAVTVARWSGWHA